MVDVPNLIGIPFQFGGRGPDTFDCYGLIMHLYREKHGIELPDYASPTDQAMISAVFGSQLPLWQKCPAGEGAVALIRLGRLVSHCGYMLDDNHMLHTSQAAAGVSLQRLDHWRHRLIGCYRYVG